MENKLVHLTRQLNEYIYNSSGSNKYSSLIHTLAGIMPRNSITELPIVDNGYVFFGRPKLNLQGSSLKQDRILAMLNTLTPDSLAFAIRCYLDEHFAIRSDIISLANQCDLYNSYANFIPILTNQLETLTGWPEPSIETETTEGGFFSENITIAKGHNDLNKTITTTATFDDIAGYPIFNLFLIWFRFMHLVTRGVVKPYNKYIEEYKIFYSLAIYRFTLDVSGKYIEFWSKGTTCFPTGYPIVDKLDFNRSQTRKLVNKCSIPITINFPEYMDMAILYEFNVWIKRKCPEIEQWQPLTDEQKMVFQKYAIPYINFKNGMRELEWRVDPSQIDLTSIEKKLDKTIKEIKEYLNEKESSV